MWCVPARLDPFAGVAIADETVNILAHGGPEILAGEQLERLIAAWVSGYRGIVSSAENTEAEVIVLRDIEAVLIVQAAICLPAVRQ